MSNRSSGRRRRGGRSNSNRGPNDGNRQNHRNAGNAHQLLDKYKNMARDAHQQGDRVMNEYYLQFADHYFRVMAEVNERKEEQKQAKAKQQDKHDKQGQGKPDTSDKQDKKNGAARKGKDAGSDDGQQKDDQDEAKKSPPKRAASKKADKAEKNGEELKISADVLPDAMPAAATGKEMNGKSQDKKPASRPRRKPSDGDGAAAEA